ncbi:MAG: class I SAM-dependent methyltransferase [Nanoarchaeota archaeon]
MDWPSKAYDQNKNKTLLDLGCGTGLDLVKYLEKGFDAYGTDASKVMLAEAMSLVAPERLKLARHTSIPFRDEFFDTVVTRFSLHYLDKEELKETYKEVARVLKPNGDFIAVARHPLVDLMAKPTKDYYKEEDTQVKLYGQINVICPSHIMRDYLSPLIQLFDLVDFEEGIDQADIVPKSRFKIPTYLAFKATKR